MTLAKALSMTTIARLALLLAFLCTTGCGLRLASVSGKITYKNKPVTTGNILFVPEAGGPTATADIQKDGSYSLKTDKLSGAAPGRYKVMIISMQDTSTQLPEHRNPLPNLLLPEKYADQNRSGLFATVNEGTNEIHFPLN